MQTFEDNPITAKDIVELGFVYNPIIDGYEVLYLDEFTEPVKIELHLYTGHYKHDSLTMYCHCYWVRRFQADTQTVKYINELLEFLIGHDYVPATTYNRKLKIDTLLT